MEASKLTPRAQCSTPVRAVDEKVRAGSEESDAATPGRFQAFSFRTPIGCEARRAPPEAANLPVLAAGFTRARVVATKPAKVACRVP
jgi:hypothetical protein